jgi:SAM-dependent methyltransferase
MVRYLIFAVRLHLAREHLLYAIHPDQASGILSCLSVISLCPPGREIYIIVWELKRDMIQYEAQFNKAILSLREVLLERHFDLLVRQLKLSGFYFQEPGFIYYRHSIEKSLTSLDNRYAVPVRLFCLNQSLSPDDISLHLLPAPVLDDLIDLGLFIEQDGLIRTDHYGIVPYLGNFMIATIGTVRSIGAYLGRQSYVLASSLFTHDFESLLDLGSGSGLLAILGARRAGRAVGVDIMEEATGVAKANAVLNCVDDRVDFYCGDMYGPVLGMKFDALVANVPFVALPEKYSDLVVISSGEDGLGFLRRLLDGMFEYEPGVACMLANGLGSESGPLLFGLLKSFDLASKGYGAKLLIYSRGLLDDDFLMGIVKLVKGAFVDRGEEITSDRILADLRSLYKRLGVDYYYGIILEVVKSGAPGSIEVIDLSNRYGLDMSPVFRGSIEIGSETGWTINKDGSSMRLNSDEKALFDRLPAERIAAAGDERVDFFSSLEKIFGAEPL